MQQKIIKVKFELNPQETVLYKSPAAYFKNKWQAEQGNVYITSQRIVFESKPMMMMVLFGVLGWLLSRNKKKKDFPLADVVNFKRGKQGFNKKVAEFELIDGAVARFGLGSKFEPFDIAYQKAMMDVKPLFQVD
ncbi:MAG TPA: GRAM domain-containing protein [Chitinophaga sp.]|uniref:GRAM domain-containing protein n=1 Tax=Chitinophaga sp. TaxID=1869181 RepID=UPI002BC10BBA|nr:GRAM domain-containing protein [Chitinophaga sp.]HVI43235.1 GRAM domain-containing protein [Chitinophaga sp.]